SPCSYDFVLFGAIRGCDRIIGQQRSNAKAVLPALCRVRRDQVTDGWSGREDLNLQHPAPKAGMAASTGSSASALAFFARESCSIASLLRWVRTSCAAGQGHARASVNALTVSLFALTA